MTKSGSLTVKTLLLAFGRILASLSTLLVSIILARSLSMEDFSLHKKAILAFTVVSPAIALGLPKALYFFLPDNRSDPRAFLIANIGLLFGVGLLFAFGITFIFHDGAAALIGDDRLVDLWWMIGVYGLAMLPLSSLSSALVARGKIGWMVWFQTFSQCLLVLMVWIAATTTADVSYTIGVTMVWALAACAVAIILMLRSTSEEGGVALPEGHHFMDQVRYAVPLGLASMFGGISTELDKLMVSSLCSKQDFALYVVSAKELPIIGVVTGSMSAVILPNLASSYRRGQLQEIVSLWRRAMGKSALILIPCMFAVFIFADEFITLLFSEQYLGAAVHMRVYACLLPLRCAVYGSVLMAVDRTPLVTWTALFGLVFNCVLSYSFIGWFGAVGAAWATVFSMYAITIIMLPAIATSLSVSIMDLFDFPLLTKIVFCSATSSVLVLSCMQLDLDLGAFWLPIHLAIYSISGLFLYKLFGLGGLGEMLQFLRRRKS